MLRCRLIASLQRTVSTPPLVDFSRASHLDLFEQPARGFFQHPARPKPDSIFHERDLCLRQRCSKFACPNYINQLASHTKYRVRSRIFAQPNVELRTSTIKLERLTSNVERP
jgi:hypothetical protein